MYPELNLVYSVILVVLGLFLLERSSDAFVDGAAAIARRFRVSPFIIGMVVIGFGTCAPEFCVSLMSGLGDKANLSLGNAYGSCIFNVAAILGVTALIAPLSVKPGVVKIAGPALIAIGAVSVPMLVTGGVLSRLESAGLLAIFAVFFPLYCWLDRGSAPIEDGGGKSDDRPVRAFLVLIASLAVLIASSHLLVWGSVNLARAMGVSELMIGLTVVAIGTSLPELAAAVQSARKGQADFVLGNIIGSNLFNLLVVVGVASVFHGASGYSGNVWRRDLPVTILVTAMIGLFGRKGRLSRLDGAVLLAVFFAYVFLTIYQELS